MGILIPTNDLSLQNKVDKELLQTLKNKEDKNNFLIVIIIVLIFTCLIIIILTAFFIGIYNNFTSDDIIYIFATLVIIPFGFLILVIFLV